MGATELVHIDKAQKKVNIEVSRIFLDTGSSVVQHRESVKIRLSCSRMMEYICSTQDTTSSSEMWGNGWAGILTSGGVGKGCDQACHLCTPVADFQCS